MIPAVDAKSDKLFLSGLILVGISLALFCIPYLGGPNQDNTSLFFIHYIIAAGYFGFLLYTRWVNKGRERLFPLFAFLVLFLISAYSLNRDVVIFEKPVPWFAVLQVVLCVNFLGFAFFAHLPRLLQHIMVFILGIGLVSFIYLCCYLAPLFIPGIVLSFVLGISLHTFAPLLFVIYTLVLMGKLTASHKVYWRSFIAGLCTALAVIIVFIIRWAVITQTINTTYRQATVQDNNGLPAWVAVAQRTQHNRVTEKVLKAGLVYSRFDNDGDFFWRTPSRGFAEEKKHDPLVMLASFFAGVPNISDENRIRLLESVYDSRHQAQERLWRGDDLWTEHINTAVRIWPQYGISYTEKEIIVSSNAQVRNGWGNRQEALYTFHFPEGAVVTSLSLWIEGRESPGILTTKQKADNAYKTIVGREMRDPSVVHWQEGNTVTVRVFPVEAGQSRKFKIGVTAPLNRRGKKMVYENIWFDGPACNHAKEDVALTFQQNLQHVIAPALFEQNGSQCYTRSGKYDPNWSIELDDQVLAGNAFSFNGNTYTIRPYQKQRAPAVFNTIYLDVNKAWTKDEFNEIIQAAKNRDVYVFHNRLVKLTHENKDDLFDALHQYQFSLFPVYLVNDATSSLLISKSTLTSPNIKDLDSSRFMTSLKASLHRPQKIRLFNIGTHLSPYLRSLKEFRLFQYEHGNTTDLKNLLHSRQFARDIENDNLVVLYDAEMAITKQEGTEPTGAPDHLMRLFAYNHIMQKTGPCLLSDDEALPELIDEAQQAYVVSPVSSLVVLESQKDYERFDLQDSKNSLKNASLKSKGAVPEPHEWALILLAIGVLVLVKWKPKLQS